MPKKSKLSYEEKFYRHPIPWCDGTNKHIMWSDDTYMSCPFL